MAILVTGGAGFIGSHTCVVLQEAGYDIVVADNFSNSKPEALARIKKITGKDFRFYEADILDADAMNKIFDENEIEAVIHFAGLKAVGESVAKPIEYYHNNITGSLVLFDAMRNHGCKTIVFSSSATVYGMNNIPPFVETMPLSTTNPYGSTKLFIEDILRDICVSDPEWSAMLLRYFNPIGAHPSGLIGESPNDIPNNLFPYIASVAVGRLEKLGVFGDDYPTVDGTGVRDYIHVMDLADGHVRALKYALKHKGAEAVNLGTGREQAYCRRSRPLKRAAVCLFPTSSSPADRATSPNVTPTAPRQSSFSAGRQSTTWRTCAVTAGISSETIPTDCKARSLAALT